MATRSKQSGTDSNPELENASAVYTKPQKERATWTQDDETALITFLLKHKSEAGDGGNFKSSTWTLVATKMNGLKKKGGEKTADSCKGKWTRVCRSQ
jgi:hypothetical protein